MRSVSLVQYPYECKYTEQNISCANYRDNVCMQRTDNSYRPIHVDSLALMLRVISE